MQRTGRAAAVAAALAMASSVGACAPPRPVTVVSGTASMPVAIVGAGMIVAIRPVAPVRAADAGGADPRGSLLHTLGVADADTADDRPVEFIVREDGGETVSVMQVNTENLLAGERVLLTASDRTRLSHGALPLPAGG